MPTTTGTTSTDLALSLRTTYTTPLLTNIATGKDITASDINMLAAFANTVLNHTHTFTEYTEIHEYGNTKTTVTVAGTTTIPKETSMVARGWSNVVAGNDITVSVYNVLSGAANDLISHEHDFTDSY